MLHIADGHTAQTYTVEVRQFWSRGRALNPRPPDYEGLVRHFAMFFSVGDLRENAAVDPEPGLVGAYLLVHPPSDVLAEAPAHRAAQPRRPAPRDS